MFVHVLLPQGTWFCISWWLFLALFVFRCARTTVGGTKGWNTLGGRHKIFPFTSYQYPSLTPAVASHVVPAAVVQPQARGELGTSCGGRSSLSWHLPRRSDSGLLSWVLRQVIFPFTSCMCTNGRLLCILWHFCAGRLPLTLGELVQVCSGVSEWSNSHGKWDTKCQEDLIIRRWNISH